MQGDFEHHDRRTTDLENKLSEIQDSLGKQGLVDAARDIDKDMTQLKVCRDKLGCESEVNRLIKRFKKAKAAGVPIGNDDYLNNPYGRIVTPKEFADKQKLSDRLDKELTLGTIHSTNRAHNGTPSSKSTIGKLGSKFQFIEDIEMFPGLFATAGREIINLPLPEAVPVVNPYFWSLCTNGYVEDCQPSELHLAEATYNDPELNKLERLMERGYRHQRFPERLIPRDSKKRLPFPL